MFRKMSPFLFSGLLPALCSIQGLPGADVGGGGTPPAPPAGGTPAAAGAPAPDPKTNSGQFDPNWLNDRLTQAKRNAEADLLKDLGVSDKDAAKKLLADGKTAADAQKTELQRKDDEIKALQPHKAQADTYRTALQLRADTELKTLPEAAQTRIKSLVGEGADPLKVLEAVDLARAMAPAAGAPAGTNAGGQQGQGQPGQGSAPGQGQPQPPVVPAGANTTGALGGPPSAGGSPPDHLAIWTDMQGKNPMAAAQYFLANQQAIVSAQQAKNK